ncbi:MAG: hypothetical protein S4CHLAM81_01180 [Chlamydiales bacterium]|nr:hypothetical protein [Chlamydiales bacterium]MCH9634914.1 hypothetical protein [Chlamydiales bacterium]MCH9704435.1 hypothetical protein [Chlamydiota bacterium]
MNGPPPGYDDESVIPKFRLKTLLGQFEDELNTIQTIFAETVNVEYQASGRDFTAELWSLQNTAAELGSEYPFLIEKLIRDYESFKSAPDRTKLEQLCADVKSLQLLLTG